MIRVDAIGFVSGNDEMYPERTPRKVEVQYLNASGEAVPLQTFHLDDLIGQNHKEVQFDID